MPVIRKGTAREWLLALAMALAVGCERRGSEDSPPQPKRIAVTPVTNMVPIKAGTFLRGTNRITLTGDFWIGKYEVTQAEYGALAAGNPSHFPGNPQRPVEKISQVDAAAYCTALTQRERSAGRLPPGYVYRLPTEAEWEYACRAGSTNLFSFGDDEGLVDQYAWTSKNSEATTHPVGQKLPNAWGLYDMHGNVWEWCQDWFAPFPVGDLTNPGGPPPSKFKVFRGGGWDHDPKFARCATRFMMVPSNGISFVGFRLVLGGEAPLPR